MNPQLLPDEAAEPFRFLFEEHGARILRMDRSPSFGDWFADVESDCLCIRSGKDRGQPFMDIGSSYTAPECFDMDVLQELALGHGGGSTRTFEGAAEFLQGHYAILSALFGPEKSADTAKRLSELRHHRARRMFPEWLGESK